MFLDDKLFELCKNNPFNTVEWIGKLYDDVMSTCHSYIKSKIYPNMERKEAKTIINRTFNYFDAFVKKAKASEDQKMKNIGKLFEEEFHFKKHYLSNEKIKEIYENL